MRPLCINCRQNPAAINYYKDNKLYYRKKCESCVRYGGKGKQPPRWKLHGYEKKLFCEKCGFKSSYQEQFDVYHLDGDLNNCRPSNLKTICANCQRLVQKEGHRWRQGGLIPDL